jgi:hypothetical protein
MIFVVGAAPIASPAQTLTTLHHFAVGNGGAYLVEGLVQGTDGNF